jgi:hypothetical protein
MTQNEFIDKLFDGLGFAPSQRRAWLFAEYKHKYADALTVAQKSTLIDRLRKMRDEKQESPSRFKRETTFGEEE